MLIPYRPRLHDRIRKLHPPRDKLVRVPRQSAAARTQQQDTGIQVGPAGRTEPGPATFDAAEIRGGEAG